MNPAIQAVNILQRTVSENSYSSEYQAVLDRATALNITPPSDAKNIAINAFIEYLKNPTQNLWNRCKTLNICGFSSDINFCTLNLKSPTTYQWTFPVVPQHSEGNGIRSVASGYANTQYAVNEYAGIESDLTTAIDVTESSTVSNAGNCVVGSRAQVAATTNEYKIVPLATATVMQKNGYAPIQSLSKTNHKGLVIMTYDGVNSVTYLDGVKNNQATTPVAPDLSNKVFFLARNGNTSGGSTPGSFYPFYSSLLSRFDRFSDADAAYFRTGWLTLKAAVGMP